MHPELRTEVLHRLSNVETRLTLMRQMVEEDKDCAELLGETNAIRQFIRDLDLLILRDHLSTCVVKGIREKNAQAISELVELYALTGM